MSGPQIEFEETEFDFGEIREGEKVTHIYRFENVGQDTLVIKEVRTSCGCTAAIVSSKRIAPKETGEIKATFNSRGRKGEQSKTIWVYSNDPDSPTAQLKVKSTIIPTVKFYLFYSEDCEDCEFVKDRVLPPLEEKYNLEVKFLGMDQLRNYELLVKFEEKYDDTDNDVPVVVIGEQILGGPKEAREQLESIVQQYAETGCDFPSLRERSAASTAGMKKVYLAYFYTKGCRECDRITYDLNYFEKKLRSLVVKRFDMDERENKKLNEAMCELYEVPPRKRLVAPMVFVGKKFLTKKEISRKTLEALIKESEPTGTEIPWEEARAFQERSEMSIRERFKSMSAFTVLSAGLIDGVNPCAMATLVLFISFLSFIGRKGKDLLFVGAVFTSAVYVSYFLIGMGIFHFLKGMGFASTLGKAVFTGAAILALMFGVLSVYDHLKFKRGSYEEAKLKLPKFLKRRVDSVIREGAGIRNYILAAAAVGLIISITEFVCTGQVYLPTIAFIAEVPSLRMKGLAYLFLYNIAFVVPLIVVFTAAYRGTTSMDLSLFWRKHVKSVKLVTAILFFVLAGLLLFYAYH